MSGLPSYEGDIWGDISDSYSSYITDSSPSHSSSGYHAVPPTYQLPPATSQTVLVAGCSPGTGLDVAGSYALAGARIMLTSRGQEALDHAIADLRLCYPNAEVAGRLHDFADEAAVRALWRDLNRANVIVDVLILNVAKKWPPATLLGMGSKKGRKGYSCNLVAPAVWTECFMRQRERDPSRDLVGFSSAGRMTLC
jgi:short-subunit dehydrogenase